jgi:SecY interacting protein Syd
MKSAESLKAQLWQFSQDYIAQYQEKNDSLPITDIDPQVVSPCQVSTLADEKCTWKPAKVSENLNFDNVEQALEITIHADFIDYFCTFYADSIKAKTVDGKLTLLFIWHSNDFLRLQENIIGHILMKQKLKQAITLFFALTDEEDIILSLNNETGEIWAERVGCEPHKKLANSMGEFIKSLTFDIN